MYNKRSLSKDTKASKAPKSISKPKDIILDPMGQWKYPGQNTRIPGNDITMQGVNYPVLGVGSNGQQQMMYPGQDYKFQGAEYVDEYPQMKKGGGLKSKKYSRDLEATNYLFHESPLFKKPKSKKKKIYHPKAKHYQEGGTPYNYNPYVSNEPEVEETPREFNPIRTENDPEDYQQFLDYSNTAPENRRPGENYTYGNSNDYDHYGMWDALGKPQNFNQALETNPWWQPDEYDQMYHGFSVNPNTGVFLKSGKPGMKPGDTTWMEVKDHYLSDRSNSSNLTFNPDINRFQYTPNENYIETELTPEEIQQYKDGGYIVEELNDYKAGGALLTKKVTCKKCGWKWDAADGGDDVTTCHKCGGQGLIHAQRGITVSSLNDPRLLAYNDSLQIFNASNKGLNTIARGAYPEDVYGNFIHTFKRDNSTSDDDYIGPRSRIRMEPSGYAGGDYAFPMFDKPKVKVTYQEPIPELKVRPLDSGIPASANEITPLNLGMPVNKPTTIEAEDISSKIPIYKEVVDYGYYSDGTPYIKGRKQVIVGYENVGGKNYKRVPLDQKSMRGYKKGGLVKAQNGKSFGVTQGNYGNTYYVHPDRPNSIYVKEDGKWLIKNSSTGFYFEPIKDPKGERTKNLNKNAVKATPFQVARLDNLSPYENQRQSQHVANVAGGMDPKKSEKQLRSSMEKATFDYWFETDDSQMQGNDVANAKQLYDKGLSFHEGWMNSPMYKKMLANSISKDESKIGEQRIKNFNTIPNLLFEKQPEDEPRTGGFSMSNNGQIVILPYGAGVADLSGHELSHSIDRPDYTTSVNRLIPQADINYIQNATPTLNNTPRWKDYSPDWQQLILKDSGYLQKEQDWIDYVSEPTEVRARLNAIRATAKESGTYDPFTQEVTPEIYEMLQNMNYGTEEKEGFHPLNQLKYIYSDEQIMEMLNTISKNDNSSGDQLNMAKLGGMTMGQEVDLTPEQEAYLRKLGYKLERI
jgi:hypothetical protein